MIDRRTAIGYLGASAATLAFDAPARAEAHTPRLPADQAWLAQLAEGLPDAIDCVPVIEGDVPAALRGTLYRNGPGLFERRGFRKSTLLDGDGMIRAFT